MSLDFQKKIAPYAVRAGKVLGMDSNVIMAQWLYETGDGTNTGTKYNNLAGIKLTPNSVKGAYKTPDSIHAAYTNLDAFTNDYIRVMSLSYYDNIRAVAKPGVNPVVAKKVIDASPYAVADYNETGFVRYYNAARKIIGGGVDAAPTPAGTTEKKTPICSKPCRLKTCKEYKNL